MNKFRRYYNQNRKTIWGIIIIITFALAILQVANYFVKTQNEKELQNLKLQQEQQARNSGTNYANNTEQKNAPQTSSNSTQTQETNIASTQTDAIKQFITYCNNKDIESAYNMLSNECKAQVYKDLETFERLYYNNTFENQTKETTIKNWSNNTYLVYFRESALATGKIRDENQKGDYITVVRDDNKNYKLNISSFVGYKDINKETEKEQIKMQVISKNTYMEYEEYTLKITNNTDSEIKLDTLYNAESIYLQDSTGMHFPAYNHELSNALVTISRGHTRELKIKFYSTFSSSRKIKSLVFSDLQKDSQKIKYEIDL